MREDVPSPASDHSELLDGGEYLSWQRQELDTNCVVPLSLPQEYL